MPSATTAGHWCELETTEMHRGPVKQVWLVSTPMHLGYFSMNTPDDESAGTLGPALEERGFESLWFGEHADIPCSSVGLYPAEGGMPAPYRRMLDPFVSLAVAATATSALKLGTAVALPLEHDLFALAKCVSSLDRLSHGRLLLGVGVGWNEHKLANCRSFPWSQRYRAFRECILALKALWIDEEAAFHGEYFDFDPVWSDPKPFQSPHPPILCGMAGKLGTKHAIEWADGWLPLDVGLGDVERKVRLFHDAAAREGRSDVPVTIVAWGNPSLDVLLHYQDLGVERVLLGAARDQIDDPATTFEFVDFYAELLNRLR